MSIKKYTDWASWWDGLRTNLIKCIGTTGTSWLGSNAIASSGIPGLSNLGLNWKQAIGLFAVHLGLEAFSYMRDNQPKVITQETNEKIVVTSPTTGEEMSATRNTITTTPVENKSNENK